MINFSNLEQAKRAISKEEYPKIILAQNDEFNRKIIEYGKFDIIFSLENNSKNKIRQTDSGFNHILAKIASKNNIAIGIDLEKIKKMETKEKGEILSKIKQNIKISKKYKTKLAVKTKRIQEAKNFLIGLGASSKQVSETIVF
jgi:ribonuclease P/MRP protein subunit RPP1